MQVRILPANDGAPAGKLAEAEVCFSDGLLAGLKLVGFTVWEGRDERGRHVTFPARPYSVNGERRHYALLRAVTDTSDGDALRSRILETYAAFESSDVASARPS